VEAPKYANTCEGVTHARCARNLHSRSGPPWLLPME